MRCPYYYSFIVSVQAYTIASILFTGYKKNKKLLRISFFMLIFALQ